MGSNISPMAQGQSVFDMLSAIEKGELVLDLEQACHDAVQAAVEHSKAAKVTIEVTFTPDRRLGAMRVGGDIKTKLPRKTTKESLFFTTPEGNLSRFDSRQPDMFHKDAPVTTIEDEEDDDNDD